MAAYLLLAGFPQNFRIAERNADMIRTSIRQAMEEATIAEVPIEMGNDPTNLPMLTVNGAALAWFTVVYADDPALD
jgi:hypothetical protein